jgi:hypothetical protein
MIIWDASSKITHTTLLSTKDSAFPHLLTQLLDSKDTSQIIESKPFTLIMLKSSSPKPLQHIVTPLGLP